MNAPQDISQLLDSKITDVVISCKTHGDQIAKSYFGSTPKCPACELEKQSQREELDRKDRLKQNMDLANLPDMFRNASLKDWETTDDSQPAKLAKIREYAEGLIEYRGSPNLFLSGNTGTGKTRLACVCISYASKKMIRAQYVTSAEFIQQIRESWDSKTRTRFESEIIAHYGDIPVLHLDDLGVGDTIKGSQDIFFSLIDRRYRQGLPTIITTNLLESPLRHVLGDRAYDRLTQNCLWVECLWPSYRQLKSKFVRV